jgi:hypothetical protein
MLYQKDIILPPNTTSLTAVYETVALLPGTVTKVSILFPPGCNALARLEIYNKSFKLWPSSPDESFFGDTYPIEWTEDYDINETPYELILKGWNLDELYTHTVTVKFAVLTGNDGWETYFRKLVGIPG